MKRVSYVWPPKPIGLIELIGGSYIATAPQFAYRNLIERLASKHIAIHSWKYIPGFDHQSQANQAWKDLRYCRLKLIARLGFTPNTYRLGHSLGSKLHLLSPDSGRNCNGFISLCFNNSSAENSVPIINNMPSDIRLLKEFYPSPSHTMRIIFDRYYQPNNLLISFDNDKLDESLTLLKVLNQRIYDKSSDILLTGDHLTPVSSGLSQKLLGKWADINRAKNLNRVIDVIYDWIIDRN